MSNKHTLNVYYPSRTQTGYTTDYTCERHTPSGHYLIADSIFLIPLMNLFLEETLLGYFGYYQVSETGVVLVGYTRVSPGILSGVALLRATGQELLFLCI